MVPANFSTLPDVNGTTFVTAISHPIGDTQLTFAPIRALGFDYAGAIYSSVDGILTTSNGDSFGLAKSDNSARAFIGLLYTGPETFTFLTWGRDNADNSNNFGAGIDNVEAFSASVPLPAAAWLLGSALGGIVVRDDAASLSKKFLRTPILKPLPSGFFV